MGGGSHHTKLDMMTTTFYFVLLFLLQLRARFQIVYVIRSVFYDKKYLILRRLRDLVSSFCFFESVKQKESRRHKYSN